MNSPFEGEVSEDERRPPLPKIKKGCGGRPTFMSNWILETKFSDETSAFEHLTAEGIWSIDSRRCYSTQSGRKIHYQCNRAKANGAMCSIKKCLYFPKNSDEVWLYRTDSIHHHDKTSPTVTNSKYFRRLASIGRVRKQLRPPMENSLKHRISKLISDIDSPKEIMLKLESEGYEVNNREVQIRNYCSSIRRFKNTIKWKIEKKFTSIDEAKIYLKQQKIWNYRYRNHSRLGVTYHYRCKFVPNAGPQCDARKYFKFNRYTNDVTLYQRDCPHTHEDIMRSSHLNVDTKTNWLLKQVRKHDRNFLINRGFKVLQGVGLRDCLIEPIDSSTSFHDKQLTIQQKSCTNSGYQIKEEVVKDDENFTIPVEVNLQEGYYDKNKKLNDCKIKLPNPCFTSNWIFEKKFDNEDMAVDYLAKDGGWSIDPRRVYPIQGGRKVHFRCNRVKVNGPQCAAWKCLLYTVENDEISLYKTNSEHTHNTIAEQYRTSQSSVRQRMLKQRRILHGSKGGQTKIVKKLSSFKNSRNIITKEENIIEPVKLEQLLVVNQSPESQISNEINSTSIELITGNDSIQYVINYLDDNHTSNEDDTSKVSQITATPSEYKPQITGRPTDCLNNFQSSIAETAIVTPFNSDSYESVTKMDVELMEIDDAKDLEFNVAGLKKKNNWKLKFKLSNKDMVSSFLNKQNFWRCKHRSGRTSKTIYYCSTENCTALMCLIYYNPPRKEVLVYRNGEHSHDVVELNDVPLHFRDKCIPDSYLNSNIIMKEELIIDDGSIDCNVYNTDAGNCSTSYSTQNWNFEKKFANLKDANQFVIESNGLWKIESTTKQKFIYRCIYPCEPECSAQIYFLIHNAGKEVLYFSGDPHNHLQETNNEKPPAMFNEYTFKAKFPNLITAKEKMKEECDTWVQKCSRMNTTEYRKYYWCDYKTELGICTSRVLIMGKIDSDEVLYYTSGSHFHGDNDKNVDINKISNFAIPTENAVEIIISDDSDEDSLNGDDVENDRNKWVFEKKFCDYKTAKNYITNLNLVTLKSNIAKSNVKEYYNCNLATKSIDQCPASKYLLYKDLDSDVLMYNRDIKHVNNCSNVIPPLIPIQKRSMNVINLVENDDNCADKESNVVLLCESDEDTTALESQQDILLNDENSWILEQEFESSLEAIEYLKDKQIWSFKFKTKSKEGVKEFYRCNLTRKNGLPCAAIKCLHTKYALKGTGLYQTEQNHTHDPHSLAAQANLVYEALDNATKLNIKELIKAGHKPAQIITMLNLNKHLYYSINKLCVILNENIAQENSIFLNSIENWLSVITTIPDSHDTHYCVDFNVNHSDNSFQCFLSTRRLLKNAVDCDLVHLDSGCTFQWQKNPITIVGTTDFDQNFHLFGISICSHKYGRDYEFMFKAIQKGVHECYNKFFKPECLMLDDNVVVYNAFLKTFGVTSKIGTYSNVALSKIISKLTLCPNAQMREDVIKDIIKMQKLSSRDLFCKAADLFFQKWRPLGGNQLKEFLIYFKAYWIDQKPNWFQGFRKFTPTTNSAIRLEFDSLRKNYTFKHKLPLQSFRYHIQVEIQQLSRRYTFGNPLKQFVNKTTIPLSVYEKAIEWNNLEKQIEIVNQNSEVFYYITAGDDRFINETKLQKYQACNHETFEEFFEVQYSFWFVRRIKNSVTLTCNCPFFLKKFICKHSLGMASVLNLINFPRVNQIFYSSLNNSEIVNYINST